MNKIDHHKNICDHIHEVYTAKNQDYGDSFKKSIAEFGPIAGVVWMDDKMNRIKSLIKKGGDQKVTDESMKDTLLDLANYAIMLSMELDGTGDEEGNLSTDVRNLIKEEFTDFLVKHKYPSGISDMNISYEPNYSVATWTVNINGSCMTVALPNIDLLSDLNEYERKEHYKAVIKWIASC